MASVGSGAAAAAATGAGSEDPKFQRWLQALAAEELAAAEAAADGGPTPPYGGAGVPAGGARLHDNEWYADRCVFCAACRTAIDAEPGRRGARCAGCRRWFHGKCRPEANGGGGGTGGARQAGGGGTGRFFHCDECRQGYQALRREAAKGRRELPAPQPGGLAGLFAGFFGRGAEKADGEPLTLRLIDFSEVKPQYKNLQQSGLLGARRRSLLKQAGLLGPAPPLLLGTKQPQQQAAPQATSDEERGSDSEGGGWRGGAGAVGSSAVDDFILAAELLTRQYPDDTAKDILEDSFGVLLQRGGTPLSVATLNLYAPDHARIQSLVTAEDQRRRGNAAALLGELHSVLQGAGLQKVVAIIAEDTDASRAARDRLLKRRFGYRDLDIEQLVAWRAELPEYNKSLVGGFTLLERPLGAERRR